jgi:hypothetical protein
MTEETLSCGRKASGSITGSIGKNHLALLGSLSEAEFGTKHAFMGI